MASEIKVDTIVNAGGDNDTGIDLATNDQILLKVANATKLTMNSTGQTTIVGEGGTTTTSLQQGLCKAWANINGTGTIAARDSLNVSSLTDGGTGDYTYNFTNNMGNNDFTTTTSAFRDNDGYTGIYFDDQTTSKTLTRHYNRGTTTRGDVDSIYIVVQSL